ncbi:MAG: hypothetical protein ACYDAY_01900 [Candidatus Dormibacteria bacterium]
MPVLIPKPEQQATFFQDRLAPGEQLQGTFWCEQRLSLLMTMLLEQGGAVAELLFSKFRHRYFMAVTDRHVLVMGSTGWHDPIKDRFEALDRAQVKCTQYRNWFGGHVAMDLTVTGESGPRRYRIPRSQNREGQGVAAKAMM